MLKLGSEEDNLLYNAVCLQNINPYAYKIPIKYINSTTSPKQYSNSLMVTFTNSLTGTLHH